MGRVAVVLKIYPEDVSTDLSGLVEDIKKTLPPGFNLEMWELEPVAFSINILRVLVTMPENTEGGTEPLERLLASVRGVSQVEVEYVTRAPE
ncbi:MAG: elongation factor 1-beta [Desulfurococcaceae archaeon]|jgi:elongation factor 1-beta|nr:elongation factor 1-beta [Desulfurococcaceae archaeon]MCC6052848.1 elongation factor 1-beta [Desulfurococcaceae archaeon]